MGEKVEIKNEGDKPAAAAEGGGNKEVSPMTVVLKLDLHCEGCAKKVRRSVSHLEGVETVKADCNTKKLTVAGNVDPAWLREKVEIKTKKKVELISPQPKKDGGGGGATAAVADNKAEEKKVVEEIKADDSKKPKEAAVSSVTMKTKLHCDGCAHKIKRIIIKKFDGVDSVTTDLQKDSITVIGKLDVNELVTYLREKLKRGVEIIVPPKKDDGAAAKAEKGAGDEKEKEKVKVAGGGEEKKGKESEVDGGAIAKQNGEGGGGEHKKEVESKPESGGETKVEMSKMEHHGSNNPQTHYAMPMVMYNQSYGHHDYGMPMQYVDDHHQSHANTSYNMGMGMGGPPLPPPIYLNSNDNMFSDENPNGCYVM